MIPGEIGPVVSNLVKDAVQSLKDDLSSGTSSLSEFLQRNGLMTEG